MYDQPIITYSRSGGMFNSNDIYEIFPDGKVLTRTMTGGQSISGQSHISTKEIKYLELLFNKDDFFSMKGDYSAEPKPRLLMIHKIIYRHGGREHTVRVTNGGNPPKGFELIAKGIEDIVR